MEVHCISLDNKGRSDTLLPEAVDPALDILGFYDCLPNIGRLRPVISDTRGGRLIPVRMYSDVADNIYNASFKEQVRAAKRFEDFGPYVNLARIDLSATYIMANANLMLWASNDFAICLMTGILSKCELEITPDPILLRRSVHIQPFWDDIRRETAYIANRFQLKEIRNSVGGDGIKFSTLYPGQQQTIDTQLALGYTDEVPIYDGRGDRHRFMFTHRDFAGIENWPLYQANDVPEGSVVTVGYTVSLSTARWPAASMINRYIQFVIFLVDM